MVRVARAFATGHYFVLSNFINASWPASYAASRDRKVIDDCLTHISRPFSYISHFHGDGGPALCFTSTRSSGDSSGDDVLERLGIAQLCHERPMRAIVRQAKGFSNLVLGTLYLSRDRVAARVRLVPPQGGDRGRRQSPERAIDNPPAPTQAVAYRRHLKPQNLRAIRWRRALGHPRRDGKSRRVASERHFSAIF